MTRIGSCKNPPRRKFTFDEDEALRALVETNGPNDWIAIASRMPNRDSRQCKERWFHYLSPGLLQIPWNPTDDALLELRVLEHGRKWKMFENEFPGRTDINIKNRFNVISRQRKRQMRKVLHSKLMDTSRRHNFGENSPPPFAQSVPSPEPSTWWDTDTIDWDEFSQC
jgi:hypothetical protein